MLLNFNVINFKLINAIFKLKKLKLAWNAIVFEGIIPATLFPWKRYWLISLFKKFTKSLFPTFGRCFLLFPLLTLPPVNSLNVEHPRSVSWLYSSYVILTIQLKATWCFKHHVNAKSSQVCPSSPHFPELWAATDDPTVQPRCPSQVSPA